MIPLRVLLSQGLRVFFLAAGLYAVLAMTVWAGWLALLTAGQTASLPFSPPPALWHAHEMIFGYAAAVMSGFFLTAVPGWTGEKSVRGAFLTILAGAWLAGRLAMWLSGGLDPLVVAALDLAFLPALGGKIGLQLIRRPKLQNLVFLVLIASLWFGNLTTHLDWTGLGDFDAGTGLRIGLLSVTAMISIIGGRVIPAFTRNAMLRQGIESGLPQYRRPAEAVGIGSAILLPLGVAVGAPDTAIAVLALISGAAQAVRLFGWRSAWCIDQPILWSLHLGFAMLAVGYLALSIAAWGWASELGALHLLGIGAVGGMTLAMMSRAALGHTGRPLIAARPIAWAYRLVAVAALMRLIGAEAGPGWNDGAVLLSGIIWIAAFAMFSAVYWPILTTPRQNAAA